MGQKVNPIGMRLQVNRTWDSRWYADTKDYGNLLLEDLKMREFIRKECAQAGVSKIIIERPHRKCRVTIHTARPGVIIGKKGADIEGAAQEAGRMTASELHLNIVEVRKPELDAQLVARIDHAAAGAPGVVPPRDEARGAERHADGRAGDPGERRRSSGRRGNRADRMVPRGPRAAAHAARRHRLCPAEAKTPYGIIGVKVWIFKGEILEHDPSARDRRAQEAPGRTRPPRRRAARAATAPAEE
jgi:small subunit ribosomal protein S3